MSQFRPGILIALIVFAVFAGYAFLVPATYRANAVFVVEAASPASVAELPEPLEAARRLSEAILDRKTLEQLSKERAGSTDPAAQAQAAGSVRKALELDTGDAHSFSLSYKDSDPERTQSACNRLAKRAVEVAPLLLVDRSAERALDMKRGQQTQELAAFLSLHPEVAAAPPASGDVSPDRDPALFALNAEKASLEHRILELETGRGSDNPYSDPVMSDPKVLKRRLAEIEAGLNARRQAFAAKPAASPVSPGLHAEWKRLLDAVTQSSTETAHQPHPILVARLTQPALRPSSPIDPNRRLLLFFGVVFGLGLGSAFTLVARSVQQRRSRSGRPPAPTAAATRAATGPAAVQSGLTLHMPAMPALPSDLGPPVPVTPPRMQPAPAAPPIIPMPQRPISSSPPSGRSRVAPGKSTDIGLGGTMALDAARARADDSTPKSPSSRPPARRFASTLVLPPEENPSPEQERTPDPVLASANQAWEQQIRAHEVPGFAVVKPGSEPPPPAQHEPPPAPAQMYEARLPSNAPAPAATVQRTSARPLNQMKVTQPLGSFLPDAVLNERMNRAGTPSAGRSPSPTPDSRYSYVSTAPPSPEEVHLPPRSPVPTRQPQPSSQPPRSPAPKTPVRPEGNVVRVREVMTGWHPDRELTPEAQRALCAQLYPFAVESCFVLSVVSVPEARAYKSRVSAELALCLAETGHPRILLLEGDLHRPWVARVMHVDVPIGAGFSQQLSARGQRNGTPGEERWSVMGCTKSLHVLAEGMMRTPGLLLSRQFGECLSELRSYYDFIVIDGPTASLDVDSGALDAVTDGLVTVCPATGSPALARMQGLFSAKRFSAFATAP
jgi:Mrp family chromosome partitioning ATPase